MAIFLAPVFLIGIGIGYTFSCINNESDLYEKTLSESSFVDLSQENKEKYKQLTIKLKDEIENPPLLKKAQIQKNNYNDDVLSKLKEQMKNRRIKIEN